MFLHGNRKRIATYLSMNSIVNVLEVISIPLNRFHLKANPWKYYQLSHFSILTFETNWVSIFFEDFFATEGRTKEGVETNYLDNLDRNPLSNTKKKLTGTRAITV